MNPVPIATGVLGLKAYHSTASPSTIEAGLVALASRS